MSGNTKDIYFSTQLFYYVLKFMGLAFYQYDKEFKVFQTNLWSYFGVVASTSSWLGLTWMTIKSFQVQSYTTGIGSTYTDNIWKYQFILQHILIIIVIVFNFVKRKKVELFLKRINEFDHIVDKLNWKFKRVTLRYVTVVLCAVSSLLILTIQLFEIFVYEIFGEVPRRILATVQLFDYILLSEFYLVLSLQFILSTHHIKIRLVALKQNVR